MKTNKFRAKISKIQNHHHALQATNSFYKCQCYISLMTQLLAKVKNQYFSMMAQSEHLHNADSMCYCKQQICLSMFASGNLENFVR